MLSTQTLVIDNTRWWFFGFLSDIKVIQIRNGQPLRVNYCHIWSEPTYDADDYFVLPGYDAKPFQVDADYARPSTEPGTINNANMAMFVMADTDKPVLVTRVNNFINPDENELLTEFNSEILAPVRVGDPMHVRLPGPVGESVSVTEGELPVGITLSVDGYLSGTPTIAGNYHFGTKVTFTNGANPVDGFWYLRVYDGNDPAAPHNRTPETVVAT